MEQSSHLSSGASRDAHGSRSSAPTTEAFVAGSSLLRADLQLPMQQLRSVVTELFAALKSTLNDERDSAEDSLSRAAEMLRTVAADDVPSKPEAKGGLAPWQIRKVASHIEANLDRPLRSSELAVVARVSACHFSRAFRNSFGCSPLDYVTRRRVEHAQGLMLSTDAPLSQIALDCGMADQAHFSRLFRRYVGESPSVWRRARVSAGAARGRAARLEE
jgi:AraC-like DNA-binding protein